MPRCGKRARHDVIHTQVLISLCARVNCIKLWCDNSSFFFCCSVMVDTTRRCGVFIRTRTHHEDAHSATKANAKCIKVCHMAERMCKLETEAENWKRQSWLQYAWAGLEAQAKTWHSQVNCELYFVVWIGKFLIITICRTKTQTKKKRGDESLTMSMLGGCLLMSRS